MRPTVFLLWLILFPGVAWCLPGWLTSRWLLPRSTPLERMATSLLFGLLELVPSCYVLAVALRRPITVGMILVVSAVFSAAFWALGRYRPRQDVEATPGEASAQGRAVAIAVVVLALTSALFTMPRGTNTPMVFSHCPQMASMYLLEDGSGGGLRVWDPFWDRGVTHLFAHETAPGFGLANIFRDQRPGSAATLTQCYAFHGSGGLVLATFLYELLALAFGALLLARHLRFAWAVLLLDAVFLLGCRSIASYMVNENVLALGLGIGALWLLLRSPRGATLVFAAAAFVLCVAVRPVCAAYAPAIALLLWRPRSIAAFAGIAAVLALPWMISNYLHFGHPFHHPALRHVATEQQFLGIRFTFHPLNWPVADQLMRPPSSPFPLLFETPLTHLRAFGLPFFALIAAGLSALPWRRWLPLLLWSAPVYAMLTLLVALDSEKLSYGLLCFAPLPLLVGRGASALLDAGLRRRAAIAVGVAVLIGGVLPLSLRWLDLPVDPRPQYGVGGDPGTEALYDMRRTLTTPSLLPGFERLAPFSALGLLVHGAPARQGDVALEGPLVIARGHEWLFEHAFRAKLSPQPQTPPDLGGLPEDLHTTWEFALISLALRAKGGEVDVRFHFDSDTQRMRIEVDRDGVGGEPGYLTLGLEHFLLHKLEGFDFILDGEPSAVDFVLLEAWHRAGAEGLDPNYHAREGSRIARRLRIASNHGWRYRPHQGRYRVEPEPWTHVPCGAVELAGRALRVGPDALLEESPDWVLRLRKSARLSPPPPSCEELRFPDGT